MRKENFLEGKRPGTSASAPVKHGGGSVMVWHCFVVSFLKVQEENILHEFIRLEEMSSGGSELL